MDQGVMNSRLKVFDDTKKNVSQRRTPAVGVLGRGCCWKKEVKRAEKRGSISSQGSEV